MTAMPSDCSRLASTERECVKLSEDGTQVLQETVNDSVHMTPSETHRIPFMMRCSCQCGCGQAGTKLVTCRNCNKNVCYAECAMYQRCHWCVIYPEDIGRGCLACGEDYPKSEKLCQRCRASLCVACNKREHRGLCLRCSFWLITEMRSAVNLTHCPICSLQLYPDSLERCLKCHAAKCEECDLDQTFCIRCATRTEVHEESHVKKEYHTEVEWYTHCSYCCTTPLCVACDTRKKVQLCTRCSNRFMGGK